MPLVRHPLRAVAAIALATVALVSGAAALYRVEARRQRDHVRAELDAVARLKVTAIVRWREDRLRDAAELLHRPDHASRILRVIERGDPADAEHLRLDFQAVAGQDAQAIYRDIAVVDAGGRVRVALRAPEGTHAFVEEARLASSAAGGVVLADLAPREGGPPRISAVFAVGGAGGARAPVGALVLVSDPETSLYRLLRERTSDARSAETFLVRRDGADALFLSPRRHVPDAPLRTRLPLDGGRGPAVRAALGEEGTVDGPDERGTPVFSVIRRVPGTSWGLVSSLDQAEAMAPLRVHLALLAVVVLAFVGAIGAWLVLRWQGRERRHYLDLYRAELEQRAADARFRELFEHSPVAYQSLDEQGRLVDVNEEWSALLGYSADEALGRPFGDFWSERTRGGFPATFARFVSEGRIRGELELRRRDGSTLNVVATGRIQRDADGRFVRTHCIFTDITARALAEEALRERVRLQEQLAQVAAAVPGMMYSLRQRPDGTVCLPYVTDAVRDVFGFAPQDLDRDGSPLFAAMHPDDALGMKVSVAESAVTLTPWHGCWRHRHPVKGERWLEARSTPQREPDGSVVWHGFAMDVTDQRAAEQARAEHEMLRTALVEESIDGIVILDQDYHVIEANRRFAEMLDYAPEELLRLRAWDFDAAVTEGQVRARFADVSSRELFESRYRRRDGRLFDVEVSASGALVNGDVRFIAIVRDITARKRVEAQLRRSEALFRTVFNQQFQFMALLDPEGRVIAINDLPLRVAGVRREQYIGEFFWDTPGWKALPGWQQIWPERLAAAARLHEPLLTEDEFLLPDGTKGYADGATTAIRDDSGQVVYFLAEATDTTERRRAEAEREKLHAQLLQAQKMESVGRLAGGIAHDFNNMLGVILGHTALALEDAPEGTALRGSLEEIESAAQRSAELTRQLLAFARRQTVAPRVLDLNATIGGMRNMLRRLIGEDVELLWRPGDGLWPVRIDPVQVDQLLANLCINARDAITGVGRITIETDNATVDEGLRATHPGWTAGEYVRLSVSDDGCGMDADVQQRLFEPFFTTKPTGRGTGLGLATVYGIVTQNDGHIAVYSEKGHGTTFRIYLPRSDRAASGDERAAPRVEVPAARGETILLVEDEPAILRLEEQLLRRLGYAVLAAATPGDALRLAAGHPGRIDLVMTDVVMPEMNGRELAEEIARARPGVRCLYMSGYTADVIAHRGVLDDGVNFLQKPFALRDLAERVRGALDSIPAAPSA